MLAVIKKELKTYFYSPVGYVFIGLFLLMFSIFFYVDVFKYQSTNFEYIFYSGATILTFIVPVLTMRSIAEERKNGTEQLLLTSPLSITKLVLGKFIAALPLSQTSHMIRGIASGEGFSFTGIGVMVTYLVVFTAIASWFIYKKKNL